MRPVLALVPVVIALSGLAAPAAHACGMKISLAGEGLTLVQVIHKVSAEPVPVLVAARSTPVDAAVQGPTARRLAPSVAPVAAAGALADAHVPSPPEAPSVSPMLAIARPAAPLR